MAEKFDVVVIGTGTMGSAAAYHIARRGHRVIAIEQFGIVHDLGSHSGYTRIIRHAYHESPDYVPLVLRADRLWLELQAEVGETLLIRTRAIIFGPRGSAAVSGAILASEQHSLPYEKLNGAAIRKRWPQFRIPDDWEGCVDPGAGFLMVDPCIKSHVNQAKQLGAKIVVNEKVISIDATSNNVVIKTDQNTFRADRAIICAGAWTASLLKDLNLPLVVKRKTITWLKPQNAEEYSVRNFPIFLTDTPAGLLYGFPTYKNSGVKIANHSSFGAIVDPSAVDRDFQTSDAEDVLNFVKEFLPGITQEILDGKVCLYNLTPDGHFVIDFHPLHKNLVIASGFSGHGFKFAPVVGEILADLAIEGKTAHSINLFRIDRFAKK